jgi:hypothetical protein
MRFVLVNGRTLCPQTFCMLARANSTRVPDAVQRLPGEANGSRECAPDDRLRIVRSYPATTRRRRRRRADRSLRLRHVRGYLVGSAW